MADVLFYEKPGCSTNARQRALLEKSGHRVAVRSILAERWSRTSLLAYFDGLPLPFWFNRNAPQIKSREIDPDAFNASDVELALALLQTNPLLIRRPLMEVDGVRRVGFDLVALREWIGLCESDESNGGEAESKAEACSHADSTEEACRCQGDEIESSHEPGHRLES